MTGGINKWKCLAVSLLIFGLLFGWTSIGLASPIYSGSVTASFSNPVLSGYGIDYGPTQTQFILIYRDNTGTAVYAINNNINQAFIKWGSHPTSIPGYSSLLFQPNTSFSVAPGDQFSLGTLTYFNGTSGTSTNIFGVSLNLGLSLNVGGPVDPLTEQITFLPTLNYDVDPYYDADFVNFTSIPLTFHVFENDQATAEIFGMITGDPQLNLVGLQLVPGSTGGFIGQGPLQPVPEPSTVLLIGAGLVGVGLLRKRFKS